MSDFPDLYALVIRLRPERGSPPVEPRGHGAQALFLDLLRQVAPDLAQQLHADALSKPYTVAVLPEPGRVHSSDNPVELRVAFTRADLFPPVSQALFQRLPGASLRLGRVALTLADVLGTPGSHPWAGYGAFAELWTAARPAASVTLEFATPTAFGQGTRADGRPRLALLPTPEAVFPSIARRWNELAPRELHVEEVLVEAAARDTLVSRYALETAQINLGKGPQKGFLGLCSYELPPDPAQARTLSLLADAVFYLGVGMKTARGMGLCRRIPEQRTQNREQR
jgi:CRISPR-associated endoribonuclease Cas6